MTNREKIQWLGRYRREKSRERLLYEEYAVLERQAREAAARDGQAPAWLTGGLAEARRELDAQAARCLLLRRQLVRAISRLDDERQREVLRRRFLLGQTAAQAADEMGVVARRVEQLQTEGVRALDTRPRRRPAAPSGRWRTAQVVGTGTKNG